MFYKGATFIAKNILSQKIKLTSINAEKAKTYKTFCFVTLSKVASKNIKRQ
jgi:hypothetical protein